LDLRLNFDPGVAYYVIDVEKHRLWGELGYDLQYDIRDEEVIEAATEPLDKTQARHSARAFVGYQNDLNEAVRFNTGVEYIQAIVDTENWRLNWQAGLTSSISTNFSLATTFSLAYDNNPLPGVENTDTTTALSLVYTLL
jgi:putative salt-induced outer membrane protein